MVRFLLLLKLNSLSEQLENMRISKIIRNQTPYLVDTCFVPALLIVRTPTTKFNPISGKCSEFVFESICYREGESIGGCDVHFSSDSITFLQRVRQ